MGITQQLGASSLIRPGVIDNTAARPASPFEGQVIYQKDTDTVLIWNGTAWSPTSGVNKNVLIGKLTRTTSATSVGGASTNIFTNSVSFTADGSSVYRVEMFAQYVNIATSSQDMSVELRDGSTTVARIGYYLGSFYIPVTIKYEWTPSAGSHSVNIALARSGSTDQTMFGSATNPITLNVYGPDLS
jgi:hypothetical protein